MGIQGLRDTELFTVTGQRPNNWREAVLFLEPNGSAPLLALTSAMPSEKTDDPLYHWFEEEMQSRRFTLGADAGTGTSIDLSGSGNANTLKPGDLLYVEHTGEIIRVATIVDDDNITVTRSIGSVAATTVDFDGAAVNPNLFVMGSSYEEGSSKPTGIAYDPVEKNNYCQIFRDAVEITRTASKTRLRTGDEVRRQKKNSLLYHSTGIEKAIIFGEKTLSTVNGRPMRTTDGIINYIDSGNIKSVAAPGTGEKFEAFEENMELMFRYGSDEKMAFCGNRAMLAIQQMVRKNGSYNIEQGQKEFGMNILRIMSPFGTLVLKRHPLFNQVLSASGAQTYYALDTWLLVLDMAELKWRFIDDTKFDPDMKTPGDDRMVGGYLTEGGLEVHHPKTHFLYKGLYKGLAD